MLPGPVIFYSCPKCGAEFYNHSLATGNTFGALIYSDGHIGASMCPGYPNLTKCKECGIILKLSELKPIDKISPFYLHGHEEYYDKGRTNRRILHLQHLLKCDIDEKQKAEIYNQLEVINRCIELYKNKKNKCEHLVINDLYRALNIFPEDELSIRLSIWRIYNNKVRSYVDSHSEELSAIDNLLDSKEYQSNCLALLNLLNKDNREERILLAELYRNLGNFKECMALIPESARNSYMGIECERGNRYTVRIDNYYEILEAKAKQEAERKEQERINEEKKDPRWKICPNGHCYENIRKECPWCGKDNIVGRLDKDVSLQHKELYVGKQNGHYILSSDASIPMQEERIRKITIDYYQDKFVYFRMDGKNPHPFYFNTIRLNQGCIKGRTLTKLCEDILVGKYNYVDLSSYIE